MAKTKSLCALVGGLGLGYVGALAGIAYQSSLYAMFGPFGPIIPAIGGAIAGTYGGSNACNYKSK